MGGETTTGENYDRDCEVGRRGNDTRMKVTLMTLVLVAACGGDDGGSVATMPCSDFASMVQQKRGTCRLSGESCPSVQPAFCDASGDEAACQLFPGWHIGCDGGPGEPATNCTYSGDCSVRATGVEFDYIQTFDGIDGLAVRVGDQCEFRPCL